MSTEFTLTPEIEEEILRWYRKTESPFKVCRQTGIPIDIVWQVIDANPEALIEFTERHGGEGRPDILPYRVAKAKISEAWNNNDPAIAKARADLEAGTHTMATGRDGGYRLLYSFPLKDHTPRPDYFLPEAI